MSLKYVLILSCLGVELFALVLCAGTVRPAHSASLPRTPPDVLVFANGDRVTGRLERMKGGTVFFKSEDAGELSVTWGKIRELHVPEPFAVIPVGITVRFGLPDKLVPQGSIDVAGPQLTVHTAAGEVVLPVDKVAYLVDETTYKTNVTHEPGLLQGWTGSVTAGASMVESTQNVSTFNSGIALARTVPSAPWMVPADRTLLGFTSTYGSISQPNAPALETNIFHGSAEQDKYVSSDFYALAQAIFDHNSTQGLNLQQTYGGGVGYNILRSARQEFDVTVTLNYTGQQFQIAASNQNLIGSTIANNYSYKFPRNVLLTENSSVTPEFNNPRAYSANLSVGLAIPVFERLSFSLQAIDSYLNDPAPGFNCNSLQLNSGLTYTLP